MAKRFTESTKWDDPWYRRLKPVMKNFWDYICCRCDASGVWKPDFDMARFFVGAPIPSECIDIINEGKNRVRVLDNGYWQIIDWTVFQYGKELNPKIGAHRGVILQISKHLHIGYLYDSLTIRVTDTLKEIEKEMEKEKEKEKHNNTTKKECEKFPYLNDPTFQLSLTNYLEMRKKIRKPATDAAVAMALKELHKHPVDIAIQMLDRSTLNSWQGIFPLKDDLKPIVKPVDATNYDALIESTLGKIATKEMIKKVLVQMPEKLWWKVRKFLDARYPGGGNGFVESEREIMRERRDSLDKLGKMTEVIGNAVR